MPEPYPDETVARAAELYATGVPVASIAERMGVSAKTVYRYMSTHAARTGIQRKKAVSTRLKLGEFVRGGSLFDFARTLPQETLDWLVDNIPPGGTMIDILRAIVVDAHEEEKEGSA